MGHSQHVTSSTMRLLLANQVEDILNGREEQFKVRETTGMGKGNVSEIRKKSPVKVRQVLPRNSKKSILTATSSFETERKMNKERRRKRKKNIVLMTEDLEDT